MSTDSIDHKLEGLLRHWVKSCDILFAIHPMDGSLLTWLYFIFSFVMGFPEKSGSAFLC